MAVGIVTADRSRGDATCDTGRECHEIPLSRFPFLRHCRAAAWSIDIRFDQRRDVGRRAWSWFATTAPMCPLARDFPREIAVIGA